MSKNPSYEEIQAIVNKLAEIPIEERDFHIDYLSKEMSDVEPEKYAAILRGIFDMIDKAEEEFNAKQSIR
jgi:hypothetical protein